MVLGRFKIEADPKGEVFHEAGDPAKGGILAMRYLVD
jgi:hypothetical protein